MSGVIEHEQQPRVFLFRFPSPAVKERPVVNPGRNSRIKKCVAALLISQHFLATGLGFHALDFSEEAVVMP